MIRFSSSRRAMLLAGLSVAALPSLASDGAYERIPKALWVWLRDAEEMPQVLSLCRRDNFSKIWLHLDRSLRTRLLAGDPSAWKAVQAPKAAGIECLALAGEADWGLARELPSTLTQLLEIQRHEPLFTGIHLDIEPQSRADWHVPEMRKTHLQGMHRIVTGLREAWPNARLEMALNPRAMLLPDSDGKDAIGYLAGHLDEVSLMAYRDNPSRQLEWAKPAIARLEAISMAWRMGVLCNSSNETGTSYAGSAPGKFKADMQTLWADLQGNRHVQGLAVENFRSLQTLLGS